MVFWIIIRICVIWFELHAKDQEAQMMFWIIIRNCVISFILLYSISDIFSCNIVYLFFYIYIYYKLVYHHSINIQDTTKICKVMDNIVKLNVGGTKFYTKISTLQKHPETRIGQLNFQSQEYIAEKHFFFFDRNPELFNIILGTGGSPRRLSMMVWYCTVALNLSNAKDILTINYVISCYSIISLESHFTSGRSNSVAILIFLRAQGIVTIKIKFPVD